MSRLAKSESSFLDRDLGGPSFTRVSEREFGRSSAPDPTPFFESKFIENLVFVIMPFQGSGMSAVHVAIKEECGRLGLNAVRVDEIFGSGVVLRDILTFVQMAEFIVCDLTYARQNVFYELGFAHGVGNHGSNTLLVAKEGTTLPFDIAPLRVDYYRSVKDLSRILSFNLKQMKESRK